MSELTEFFYPLPAKRTVGGIVGWWEGRRLKYNLIVGGAGLVSLGAMTVISLIPPGLPGFFVPWQGIVAFGVMANVCYLLGPSVEILVEKLFRGQILPVGPSLFRMGLTFSVGLALLPTLIAVIAWIAHLVGLIV